MIKYAASSFDVGGIKGVLGGPGGSQTDPGLGAAADTFVSTINVVVYTATVVSGLILLGMLIMGGFLICQRTFHGLCRSKVNC